MEGKYRAFVSIQLMSPASGDLVYKTTNVTLAESFHSINVPSEWGHVGLLLGLRLLINVSIQLMSPASGDRNFTPQDINYGH